MESHINRPHPTQPWQLKRGAEAGLTLFEIASIITRPFEGCDEEASDLEKFAAYARQAIEVSCMGFLPSVGWGRWEGECVCACIQV